MTESFIIYRNPVEAAVWNSVMDNPMFIVSIFGFMILTLVMVAVLSSALDHVKRRTKMSWEQHTTIIRILIVLAVICNGYLMFFLLPSL